MSMGILHGHLGGSPPTLIQWIDKTRQQAVGWPAPQ